MAEHLTADERAAALRVANLFAAVFDDDVRGREVLAHLEKVFAKPPVFVGGIDAVLGLTRNVAHRELLDFIHNQIERARTSAEPTTTPEAKDGATHGRSR